MDFQAELNREREKLQRITGVARHSTTPFFADLYGWEGDPLIDPDELMKNLGVMFESSRRVVVFQQICSQIRYYAGGWCPDQTRIYLEQDRMLAEGSELGVFQTVQDALTFTEQYLVEELNFQSIGIPRTVRYSSPTTLNCKG